MPHPASESKAFPCAAFSRYTVFMSFDALKLENQLCHRLYATANAFTRAYRPLLEPLGLTYPQYIVLMSLWERDHISIQDLIAHTHVDGGSLTQILNKLQHKGLLSLQVDSEDARKRRVVLTEQGQQLKNKAVQVPQHLACQLQELSPESALQLIQLLDQLHAELTAL